MNSLLPNRAGIYSVLHNNDFTKPKTAMKLEIKNEHWVLMEKLCEVLKPFEVATSQLTGELYPTLGSVYSLIHGILENHLMPKDVDPPEILFFKEKIAEKINERFMVGNEHKCDDIIASALYPCYRKLKFLSNSSNELVKTKPEKVCLKLAPEMINKGQEEIPELPTVPPKVKRI